MSPACTVAVAVAIPPIASAVASASGTPPRHDPKRMITPFFTFGVPSWIVGIGERWS
jgi:hypothetical protein